MTNAGRWTRERHVVAPATFAAFATFATHAGCGAGGGATCDCADPAITINVPADIASSVAAVSLSGPACTNVTATPTNQTNGGTAYTFTANAAGTCTVEVDLADTTFTDTLTIVQETGCCAGFYASPVSAAQVDVPESGDAG